VSTRLVWEALQNMAHARGCVIGGSWESPANPMARASRAPAGPFARSVL
jgi:hypothetical protein